MNEPSGYVEYIPARPRRLAQALMTFFSATAPNGKQGAPVKNGGRSRTSGIPWTGRKRKSA